LEDKNVLPSEEIILFIALFVLSEYAHQQGL